MSKMLTLKIAVGVFIGALAALWVFHYPEHRKAEIRKEMDDNAWNVVNALTPDIVEARCGKPDKVQIDEVIHSKYMLYGGVHISFTQGSDGQWMFLGADEVDLRLEPLGLLLARPCLDDPGKPVPLETKLKSLPRPKVK